MTHAQVTARNARIVEDLRAGHSAGDLCARHGVSEKTLRQICSTAGLPFPSPAYLRAREIALHVAEHGSVTRTSREFAIRLVRVVAACRRCRVPLPPRMGPTPPRLKTFQALKMLLDGERITDVAYRFHVSISRIWQIAEQAREAGFQLPSR